MGGRCGIVVNELNVLIAYWVGFLARLRVAESPLRFDSCDALDFLVSSIILWPYVVLFAEDFFV
jgi:hypothetical protein